MTIRTKLISFVSIFTALMLVTVTFLNVRETKSLVNGVNEKVDVLSVSISDKLGQVELQMSDAAKQALGIKGESLAKLVAKLSPTALLTWDTGVLDSYCEFACQDKDVIFCRISGPEDDTRTSFLNSNDEVLTSIVGDTAEYAVDDLVGVLSAFPSIIPCKVDIIQDDELLGYTTVYISSMDFGEFSSKFEAVLKETNELFGNLSTEISDASTEQVNGLIQKATITTICVVIVVVLSLTFLINYVVIKPINGASNKLKDLAEGDGDLTARLAVQSQDEMGILSSNFNQFVEKVQSTIKKVSQSSNTVASASSELSATSKQLSANGDQVNNQLDTVNDAGITLATNVNEIFEIAARTSEAAKSTTQSIDEMSHAINEVSENCTRGQSIANDAVSKSNEAKQVMNELDTASTEIGKIIELINNISDQTNLLALNATIEAASAGEAGKGFAVVANEVKELARQTADATDQINSQINDIRTRTECSMKAIDEISHVNEEAMQITTAIASAMEEQSTTMNQINITMASVLEQAELTTEKANTASNAAGTVSDSIAKAAESTNESMVGSQQAEAAAQELELMMNEMNTIINDFKV